MKIPLLVLSGSNTIRYPSIINHKVYCDRHNYTYRFDVVPEPDLEVVYFHKLAAIRRNLPECDWLFWLDDDAFFQQIEAPLEAVCDGAMDRSDLIFCKSPINNGLWTHLSSGNFFIRNCPETLDFLDKSLRTPIDVVRSWWDSEKFGHFTGGDQDVLVYLIETDEALKSRCSILPYVNFNCRPFHFSRKGEHFLVHFTHRNDMSKREQMTRFSNQFGLTAELLQENQAARYKAYL